MFGEMMAGGRNNSDTINDDHADYNDGTDALCALCDDGGKLLSCIGRCKRSFHPRKKDGRESKCKTLGLTSEKLKRIGTYVCKNCKYKKHQCFKCGDLEPSDEPNAKVFKCKNSSCGHFYHPKCVAKLLEPDDSDGDENCALVKRIMAGMPFTCPVHWCFECGIMEDRTQSALQFAVCRRCPKSYHRECLPREISFDTKDKQVKQRGWELSKIIMIYCLDHKICKATGNAKRDHIKFPIMPKISKVSDRCKKKVEVIGKRKRRIGQCSTKSVRISKRSSEKNEYTKSAAADSSFDHMVLKPENPATSLNKDLQFEPSAFGDADLSVLEASRGQGKKFENLSSFVMGTRMPSHAASGKSGKRGTSKPQKEMSSRTLCSVAKKCIASSEGMVDDSIQDILLKKPSSGKDAGLEIEIHKTPEDKDGNKKEKPSEHSSGKEVATNKGTSCEYEQNDVPRKIFVDKHAEEYRSELKSTEEIIMIREEKAAGRNSVSGQEEDIYMIENQLCRRPNQQASKSEGKIVRNDGSTFIPGNVGVTPDHVDIPPEKRLIARHVHRTTDKIDSQPDYGCNGDGQMPNRGNACQEPMSSHYNGNSKATIIDVSGNQSNKTREFKRNATGVNNTELEKHRRCIGDGGAHYGDPNYQDPSKLKEHDYLNDSYRKSEDNRFRCDDANRVEETSKCKTKQDTGSNRREHLTCNTKENSSKSPMGLNAQKEPMNNSTEGQRSYCDLDNQNRGNNNRYRWSITLPTFPPAGFGAGQWHGHFSHPRGPGQGITGWQSPPFHPRSPGYFTNRWQSPNLYTRRPEYADYTSYQNNLSNANHGEYHAVSTDPTYRYPPRVNSNGAYRSHMDASMRGHGATDGGRYRAYGERSIYAFGWGPRTPAGGSVTNRYAPRRE